MQCDMKQLITYLTHIDGSTLDLLYSSRPDYVMNVAVSCPGVSEYFNITASVILDVSTPSSSYTVKLYKVVNIYSR